MKIKEKKKLTKDWFYKLQNIICDNIEKYYYKCKRFYVTRKQTYKTFITILRQICKFKHLAFTSKIKYDKSKYEIVYYIYPPKN